MVLQSSTGRLFERYLSFDECVQIARVTGWFLIANETHTRHPVSQQIDRRIDVDESALEVYRRGRPNASGLDPEAVHEGLVW